jgi:hypothetical protein
LSESYLRPVGLRGSVDGAPGIIEGLRRSRSIYAQS